MSNKLVPYGYIYKTTLPNNKFYYGKKKSFLWNPNYLGSGILLNRYIKKHGKKGIICELQEWAYSLRIK